jgi:phage shock protein E
MRRPLRLLLLLAFTALLASAVGFRGPSQSLASQNGGGYVDASPREFQALLARDGPFLLDVHVPNEGFIAGTDGRIPYTEVVVRAAELPSDRDAVIAVYCMSGRMSEIAAAELVALGYRNVFNLAGGMLAWQAAGYELMPE